MSEEQGTPTEHVSMGENGAIILSEEAQRVMEGIEDSALDKPAEVAKPAAEQVPVSETNTRKIKHNGQEIEIPSDKEIELLQKGYDYDFKKAQIEQERAKLSAYQGLVSAIETSPEIRAKVSQALGYQNQPQVIEQPQFDDPIEQLKWEMRQEVLKEVEEKYAKPFQQQMQMQNQMTVLERVRQQVQADPQYNEVQTAIMEQIKSMPESIGKNLYLQLDQDPKAYMEMFQTVKQRLKSITTTEPQAKLPEPSKRETKAPILEQGNTSESVVAEEKKMNEKIKELSRRSKNGDLRATGELMNLLA